jgi:protein involved in polysaccharide export with SLBB domain
MILRKRDVLAMGLVGLIGCASSVPPLPAIPESASVPPAVADVPYRVQVGDLLAVRSYYDPQLNQDVRVRPDGRISLLLVGEMEVVDKTVPELTSAMTEAYGRLVEAPEVTVVLGEAVGMNVYFGGEVRTPSVHRLEGPLTVAQGLMLAGGLLEAGDPHQVILLRREDPRTFRSYVVDLDAILTGGAPDVYLRPSDVVHVPKTGIAEANKFVAQHIDRIIPQALRFAIGYTVFTNTGSPEASTINLGGGQP